MLTSSTLFTDRCPPEEGHPQPPPQGLSCLADRAWETSSGNNCTRTTYAGIDERAARRSPGSLFLRSALVPPPSLSPPLPCLCFVRTAFHQSSPRGGALFLFSHCCEMPFLRPVQPGTTADSIELRSSKTLIGAGASTCDVVIPDSHVLDLHALINLSSTRSSGSLVPFSTASNGVCFLNDRPVPQEGARVVHGDRVAFGDPSNAFIFELMPTASPPKRTASLVKDTSSRSVAASRDGNTKAFRRALDALRGDRDVQEQSRDTIWGKSDKIRRSGRSVGVGASRNDPLQQLLHDASMDSLLSDFVERKLSERFSRSRELGGSMIEPPSTLSSSLSMSDAAFEDSILQRSANSNLSRSQRSDRSTTLGSTAERNYAEIEKLRLSQRMRQVNRVLNGDMDFGSSYMASSLQSSAPRQSWTSGHGDNDDVLNSTLPSGSNRESVSLNHHDELSENEDEEDDELPAMMEKPTSSLPNQSISVVSSEQQVEFVRERIPEITNSVIIDEENQVSDDHHNHLEDSLPAFSEPVRVSTQSRPTTSSARRSELLNASTKVGESASSVAMTTQPVKARTALHQKLIDQAIHRKRQESLAQAFVCWKRGLRVQAQNRLRKAQQFRQLSSHLDVLRRNNMFERWKQHAEIQSQIVDCRVEAFQTRSDWRVVRRLWTRWQRCSRSASLRRRVLRLILTRLVERRLAAGFRAWQTIVQKQAIESIRLTSESDHKQKWRMRQHHVANCHHSRTTQAVQRRILLTWRALTAKSGVLEAQLSHAAHQHRQRGLRDRQRCLFDAWHTLTVNQRRRRVVINRLLRHQMSKYLVAAIVNWKIVCSVGRQAKSLEQVHRSLLASEIRRVDDQHQETKRELEDEHIKKMLELRQQSESKESELNSLRMQVANTTRAKVW